ncbi:MAG: hypothetical protein ACE148_02405 [Vicinamibacterales bacterium]
MTLQEIRALVPVPDEEMLPPPGLFLHESTLHGQAHVGRVMVHGLRLIEATGAVEETIRLWAAVYLHDIARRHDGVAPRHGAHACLRLRELPNTLGLFARAGLREADLPAVCTAVTRHSSGEGKRGEPHLLLIELLKDADGLDRVRLGDLDPRYLRIRQARCMVQFATRLFEETDGKHVPGPHYFGWLWRSALALSRKTRARETE